MLTNLIFGGKLLLGRKYIWKVCRLESIDEMIDIIIDKLTKCLEVRKTGQLSKTYYKKRRKKFTDEEIRRMYALGWRKNFNWKSIQQQGYEIFELHTKHDDMLQGYIALEHIKGQYFTYVPLVEAAPWNVGSKGEYVGVGGHLFAIACKESWDNGNAGYVMFESKSDLINHYMRILNAKIVSRQIPVRLALDTKGAADLIQKYFYSEKDEDEEDD